MRLVACVIRAQLHTRKQAFLPLRLHVRRHREGASPVAQAGVSMTHIGTATNHVDVELVQRTEVDTTSHPDRGCNNLLIVTPLHTVYNKSLQDSMRTNFC